jgi:environmental stress-induced protein Ves
VTLLRAGGLVAAPWRNGRGVTRDVVTVLGRDGDLRWQASLAELTEDCDFSDYAGFDRVFTPVAGGGIALSHDGGPFVPCPLLTLHAFAGETRTRCRIGGEAGRAFNVITARGRHRAHVEVLRLAAGMPAPSGAVLHCWSGLLDAGGDTAGPGDSLLNVPATAAAPSVVILVRIGPAG